MATKKKQAALSFMSGQAGNVQEIESAPGFPFLQWLNGNPALKALGKNDPRYTGGFFMECDLADHDEGPQWILGNRVDYTFKDGTEKAMYAIGAAQIIVLASRTDWYTGDKHNPNWVPKGKRVKGSHARNRALIIFPELLEWHKEHGPVMLSLYGVNGYLWSQRYAGGREEPGFLGIVHKAGEKLSSAAGGPSRLDTYTFMAEVEPGEAERANPKFDSLITPPVFILPSKADGAYLNKMFCGPEVQEWAGEYWAEVQEWLEDDPLGSYEEDFQDPEEAPNEDAPEEDVELNFTGNNSK